MRRKSSFIKKEISKREGTRVRALESQLKVLQTIKEPNAPTKSRINILKEQIETEREKENEEREDCL